MKLFLFFFFFFLFSLFKNNSSKDLSKREEDSSIFYYGFTNNEEYQHYMPSKYPNIQRDRDLIIMSCNKGYTVVIKRAYIIDLNDEEYDYTKIAQNICIKKEQCSIDVKKFKRNTNNNSIDSSSELRVEYICMSSQKPLYDGNIFHQGVTHKYLIVRNQSSACAQNNENVIKLESISKAIEVCTLNNCNYVVWDNEEKKAFICKEENNDNIIEKKNSVTYINPNYFYTYGYATFLNYMSVCDNIIKAVPYNLSMTKSVDVCSHLDCHYFTKSYPGSIRSLSNTRNGKSWFCKGFPTIIPMDGFITSVKLSKFI
ncbi:conserved Plasmodium protein, unknown function [Plasmodium gallinaceum]|uniref:SUEL-type lectin domain-containing protein n=1 Tax=Plasmodium gallinaceum TaxID=5849 RepID=A0A1J1GUY7_PLAGA|nr:conserved Plasmodium protein, unknown function [Plasmodium gallinaceum]CRG94857.1 conserved Plasmodium protein, unknown function [Plasmodium gallinaceum]